MHFPMSVGRMSHLRKIFECPHRDQGFGRRFTPGYPVGFSSFILRLGGFVRLISSLSSLNLQYLSSIQFLIVFIFFCTFSTAMSQFPVSTVNSGYFHAKLPSQNKGMGFTHDERAKNGMRGLYPGGTPFTLDQKVEVRIFL